MRKPTQEEAEQYAVSHRKLVRPIAEKISKKFPDSFELDDLIGAGYLGLVKAAAGYDLDSNVPFALWAKQKIKGSILDSVKREAYRWAQGSQPIESIPEPIAPGRAQSLGMKVASVVESLSNREQQLLDLIYVKGLSCRQIGERKIFNIGPRRVSQLHQETLDKVRRKLKKAA